MIEKRKAKVALYHHSLTYNPPMHTKIKAQSLERQPPLCYYEVNKSLTDDKNPRHSLDFSKQLDRHKPRYHE